MIYIIVLLSFSKKLLNMMVKLLKALGFQKVGYWELENQTVTFRLIDEKLANERGIYSFVNENTGEVYYIGICESPRTTLKERFRKYKYKQGGGTNARILEEIRMVLKNNQRVDIYAFVPKEILYKGVYVDMVRGLEYPLIQKFKPLWNKQGKS